jgi:hypothetical protein
VKPSDWTTVINWMWDNREEYSGITVFPAPDEEFTTTYKHQPFEACSEETYQYLAKQWKGFDISHVTEGEDFTNHLAALACEGGLCNSV